MFSAQEIQDSTLASLNEVRDRQGFPANGGLDVSRQKMTKIYSTPFLRLVISHSLLFQNMQFLSESVIGATGHEANMRIFPKNFFNISQANASFLALTRLTILKNGLGIYFFFLHIVCQ